jgi:hypothetical protein
MKKIITIIVGMILTAYFVLFTNTGGGLLELADNWRKGDPLIPSINEIVMPANATIEATTPEGKIIIKSGKGLKRYYSWDGATRSVVMWPRMERWYGSLGGSSAEFVGREYTKFPVEPSFNDRKCDCWGWPWSYYCSHCTP